MAKEKDILETSKLTEELCPKCKKGKLLIGLKSGLKRCVWTFGCDYKQKLIQTKFEI